MRILVLTVLMAAGVVYAHTAPVLPVATGVISQNDLLKTQNVLGQWRVEWADETKWLASLRMHAWCSR